MCRASVTRARSRGSGRPYVFLNSSRESPIHSAARACGTPSSNISLAQACRKLCAVRLPGEWMPASIPARSAASLMALLSSWLVAAREASCRAENKKSPRFGFRSVIHSSMASHAGVIHPISSSSRSRM